jgi:transcriptional regulatory protein RtcR
MYMKNRNNSISIKSRVVIGWLGVSLDEPGSGDDKSTKWRPTVSLVRHDDFPVHRFELLYQPQHQDLAETVKADIRKTSPKTTIRLTAFEFNEPRSFPEVYGALYNFAQRYKFDPEQEDYYVHLTTGTHVAQICMFLLTEARILPAYLIQTSPAKGRDRAGRYEIIDLVDPRYARIRLRTELNREKLEEDHYLKDGIETKNERFNQLIDQITHVALTSSEPILLLGPAGAGKSKLAQRIYDLKLRKKQVSGNFIPVNCATICGDTAMSALFGHKKGAYTGALQNREGLLKAADRGVIFLDEIGELGLEEQAMLLRAVEEKMFRPFGSDNEIRSDFQLIAGTNSDLKQLVRNGRFREDLLARIDHWKFSLPGLRERTEDIEPNLKFELDQYAKNRQKTIDFTAEARRKFLDFATSPDARWKRNFRDLRRAIDRMATFATTGRITTEIVEDEIRRLQEEWMDPGKKSDTGLLELLMSREKLESLDMFVKIQLKGVIKVCLKCRNISEAGRNLYSQSRTQKSSSNDSDRLRKYLDRYDIEWQQIKKLPVIDDE